MTYPQTGWWAKLFVDFDVTVPTPEINVGGQERYPASFTVALDNPSLSFDGGVRESSEFSVSGFNPLINLDVTRIERSFSINCPDPRMDFMSGERYDEEFALDLTVPTLLTSGTYYQSSVWEDNKPATIEYMNNGNADGSLSDSQTGTNGADPYWQSHIIRDLGAVKSLSHIVIGYDYLNNLPHDWGVAGTDGCSIFVGGEGGDATGGWPTEWIYVGDLPNYAASGSTNGLVTVPISGNWRWVLIRAGLPWQAEGYMCLTEFEVWGWDKIKEISFPTPTLSFVGGEHYSREFVVPVNEPSVNMVGRFIQTASFGIVCPTPSFPFRAREYHAPELFNFTTSNLNWQLPDWCDAYDMIALGGGGGGMAGGSGYANGRGGGAGTFGGRTVIRGVDIPWDVRTHIITVAAGSAAGGAGNGTGLGPSGIAGVSAGGGGGAAGSSDSQYSNVPGGFTFNGRTYWGGINRIPASGGNYSGWTGCGDGNLGGPGGGGAGGRGALIGGDPGGPGCRGEAWIYCYQLLPPPNRVGNASELKGSVSGTGVVVTLPAHNIGDLILLYGYVYPTAVPTAPAAGGTVPQWNLVGEGGGTGGGQRLWSAVATRTDHSSGTFSGASALTAVVIGNSNGVGAKVFDVGGAVSGQMTAPALTLVANNGSSQVLHFFGSNANSWQTPAPAGWTRRTGTTYVGLYSRDDTKMSSVPALTVTNNANSPTIYRCCSVEVLGK